MANATHSQAVDQNIAVIGCGNMGGALVRGFCTGIVSNPKQIVACDQDGEKVDDLVQMLGVTGSTDCVAAIREAQVVLIALKPKAVPGVLASLASALAKRSEKPLVISVAAGVTVAMIKEALGADVRVVRVMPNIACTIGQGISGIFASSEEDGALAERLFSGVGRTELLMSELDLDTVTGLSGSGPAFAAVMIEALADGGVKMGLSRIQALRMAAQTLSGAGALVMEGGLHPAQLKDMVTSPGGTTIAGLHELEKGGFRGTVVSAVEAATLRARAQLKK